MIVVLSEYIGLLNSEADSGVEWNGVVKSGGLAGLHVRLSRS